nr:cell wall / vacuolar inhibitor of fructosidase 2-like [Ipomoea batatas]
MELKMWRLVPVLVLFAALFSGQAAGDLISAICNNTDYPAFCDSTLRKFTGSPYADKKRLAQMMLMSGALDEATTTLNAIINLLKDPNLGELKKEILGSCRLGFGSAVDADANAVKDFDSGSYAKAASEVGSGADAGSACDALFKNAGLGGSPVPDGGLRHRQLAVVAQQLIKQLP